MNVEREIGSVKITFDSKLATELNTDLNQEIFDSWKGCLKIVPASVDLNISGELRPPQISGLFSILAHLTKGKPSTATVVMPTGTGKTETLLAAVCGFPAKKSLILVPSDSLRDQTVNKFSTLGRLREFNAIQEETLNPIVARLKGSAGENELDLLKMANVIVTTPQSLHLASTEVRTYIFESCTHLFVDEAHHVKAPTWQKVKDHFKSKPIVQFTATPFREDRKKVDGKIIFNYPMSSAQENGYFRKIKFSSVYEVGNNKGDLEVARKAVSQLREDISSGYNHLLMARCNTKERAAKVVEIYEEHCPDLCPVLIHSTVKKRAQKLKAILALEHKIVVCVNMLGEGFDLPELKVCALHDIHKSLPITMQFAGRFVRDRGDLGNPTFVANICDQKVEDVLKELYTEDPDWNKALERSSDVAIQREVIFQELVENSRTEGREIPVSNLRPALSTLVYRSNFADLDVDIESIPLEFGEEIESKIFEPINKLLILVTKVIVKTKWAPQNDLTEIDWRIIVLHHDESNGLLFIHDSAKAGFRKRMAEKISPGANLLLGDEVFRCFGRVERLVLQNAGLNRGKKGLLRYVMYTGTDVEKAISELAQQQSFKSNFFGKGYSAGEKVTIGCSYKGRIWSMSSAPIVDWIAWCNRLGDKLTDLSIDPNQVLSKLLRTKPLERVPDIYLIAIDWPNYCYEQTLNYFHVSHQGTWYPLDEVNLEVQSFDREVIYFEVCHQNFRVGFSFSIDENGYSVQKTHGEELTIEYGTTRKGIQHFFENDSSPNFYFEDGSMLVNNLHIVRPDDFTIPFINQTQLSALDWDVDISKESQGENKDQNTIQGQMLSMLKDSGYRIIFDDDGANEIADIVAIKDEGGKMIVELYHLKYAAGGVVGSAIGNFYEVCGQVIKGCKWVGEFEKIVQRLKYREKRRIDKNQSPRLEHGSFKDLEAIIPHANRMEKEFRYFIVQPGLNVNAPSDPVLSLLGSTDLYVLETTGINLKVIGSNNS